MGRVFVSHAANDKPLVAAFVGLLHAGMNIQPSDIFCTSLESMGIPSGQPFVDYIRKKIQKPEIVLLLLSKNYLASQFCLQEAGAAWALSLHQHPILIPPVEFDDLKAVLTGVQAGRINDRAYLNNLRDDLVERMGLRPLRTSHWEAKREEFFGRLGGLLTGCSRPVSDVTAGYQTPADRTRASEIVTNVRRLSLMKLILETSFNLKNRHLIEIVLDAGMFTTDLILRLDGVEVWRKNAPTLSSYDHEESLLIEGLKCSVHLQYIETKISGHIIINGDVIA